MNIGIIGAGRLGSALAIALRKCGFGISGVYSKSEESYGLLCQKLDIDTDNRLDIAVENSDIVFLSVPDNVIGDLALSIASEVKLKSVRRKVFFHLSGALTSDVLKPLEDMGAFTASFHPIQTFADKEHGWQELYNCYFGFEGCEEAEKHAQSIVGKLNGKMILLGKEQKTLYHAAACIISNYTVTLYHIMCEILIKAGMDSGTAVSAFMPLLKNTVDNIERLGYINALTGPISRGDYKVVGQHLDSLSDEKPEYVAIYRMLAGETVDIAVKKGNIKEEDAVILYELLNSFGSGER